MEQTDAELIEAYLAGDTAAFATLVRRHANLVYAAARRRTADPAAADDVTQAVFVVLARKAAGLRHRPTVAGWLLGVTRHVALTANRTAARRARHEQAAARPEMIMSRSPTADVSPDFFSGLSDALLTLRGVERDAITLRFFQGLSMADVGRLLGTGEDAARKRVARALDKLRRRLIGRGVALPAGGVAAGVALFGSQSAPACVVASASAAGGATVTPLASQALALLAIKKAVTLAAAVIAIVLGGAVVRAVTADGPPHPTPLVAVTTAPAATQPAPAPAAAADQPATGRVLKPDGSPAVGAFVALSVSLPSGLSHIVGTAATDAVGNFAIATQGELKDPRLTADLPQAGISTEWGWTSGTPVTLTLATPATARVRLLLPDGKPAVGQRVWPQQVSFPMLPGSFPGFCLSIENHLERWAVETDADGIATIPGLPAGGRVVLATNDARFAELTYEDGAAVEASAAGALPSVQLTTAGQIAGRVTYSDSGAPAAGLTLYAQTLNNAPHVSGGRATTDGDGHFSIPRLKPGPFVVCLDSRTVGGPWCAAAARVDVGAGEQATCELRLIHGSVITGRARNATTDQGVADLSIGLHSPANPSEAASTQSATTDDHGRYEFRVPPGHAEIYLASSPPKGLVAPAVGTPSHVAPLEIADEVAMRFDFDLHPDNIPDLTGTVVDGDGKPVSEAFVKWVTDNTRFPGEQIAVCDPTGRFTIHADDTVTLRARDGERATLAAVTAEPGASSVSLRVMDHAKYDVVVNVVDAAGRAVPTAAVELNISYGRFSSGGPKRPVDTGGTIRFDGLYKDSSYSVWADAPGFGVSQSQIKPPAPGAANPLTVALVRADQHISGVVIDDDGTGVPHLDVSLNGSSTGVMTTRTDNDGRFDFVVVPEASGLIFFPRIARSPDKPLVTQAKAGQTELRIAIPTVSIPN